MMIRRTAEELTDKKKELSKLESVLVPLYNVHTIVTKSLVLLLPRGILSYMTQVWY
jgi:hypothetical protein